MHSRLNETVIQALSILNGMKPISYTHKCAYPEKIMVLQDTVIDIYYEALQRLLFDTTHPFQFQPVHLQWQLYQLYRILNAATNSLHPTMQRDQKTLRQLLLLVESTPEIQSWLNKISSQPLELLCTGHGEILLTDACIDHFNGCQLVTYAPIGAMLDYTTSAAIENGVFNKAFVYVKDMKRMKDFRPHTYDFPRSVDQRSTERTPDMRLTSDNIYRARVLEKRTGRILLESAESLLLSQVMQCFPRSTLHWLVCLTVYASEKNPAALTANADYLIHYSNKENIPKEAYLLKLRPSTAQLKLNQSLSLFTPSKKRAELNAEIVQELKRKKLPNPRDV